MNFILWLLLLLFLVAKVDGIRCKSGCDFDMPQAEDDVLEQIFLQQQLLHCRQDNSNTPSCAKYWNSTSSKYKISLREHYERLSIDRNHSVNRINQNVKYSAGLKVQYYSVNLVIDARCYHSWTINPYHRIADCLIFILPTLYHYIERHVYSAEFQRSKKRVLLLVDESTEILCLPPTNLKAELRPIKTLMDNCLVTPFQFYLSTTYHFQCVSTSLYFASKNWFRKYNERFILTDEFISLEEQKNPFTIYNSNFQFDKFPPPSSFTTTTPFSSSSISSSLFSSQLSNSPLNSSFISTSSLYSSYEMRLNVNYYPYIPYANLFRNIIFYGFMCFCQPNLIKETEFSSQNIQLIQQFAKEMKNINSISSYLQNKIIFLKRSKTSGRYLLHSEQLLQFIQRIIDSYNQKLMGNSNSQLIAKENQLKLVTFTGMEDICSTISLFWSAKIIIGVHGAGVINTIYSRPNTLLIEITPDLLDQPGVPWRMNSKFAYMCGVFANVLVVPHNMSAKTERDIQIVYPMSINSTHINYVGQIVHDFLYFADVHKEVVVNGTSSRVMMWNKNIRVVSLV